MMTMKETSRKMILHMYVAIPMISFPYAKLTLSRLSSR